MKTKIFCDITELDQIKKFNKKKTVKDFTTNPSLMRKAGAKDYKPYSKKLLNILKNDGLEGEAKLIDVELFTVAYQIIYRYFKFAFIKLFFLIIVFCLDKIISIFSKDYSIYYYGTHISASKI